MDSQVLMSSYSPIAMEATDPPIIVPNNPEASDLKPHVYTYHCLCRHLLLATTTPLHLLPRRSRASTSDAAYILPIPPPPSPSSPAADPDGSESPEDATAPAPPSTSTTPRHQTHHALLLNPSISPKPQIHRLSSGFEKRYLWRCGRCRLVVGYQLDRAQYAGAEKESGRMEEVVYVLPGGVMRTEEMAGGKVVDEKDVMLDEDV